MSSHLGGQPPRSGPGTGSGPARRRIAGERRTRTGEPTVVEEPSEESSPSPAPQAPLQPPKPPQPPKAAKAPRPARVRKWRAPRQPGRPRTAPGWPVLAALAAAVVVLVVLAALLGLARWNVRDVRSQDRAAEASRTAPAVAERAAATVLSYDYRSLGADEKAAARYLSPAFRAKYLATMKLVADDAPKLRAKVVASVKASGVSHADPDRVTVLVYVNQTTTSTANGGQPQVALNRALFSMVRSHGTWLVDNITAY